MRVWTAQAGKRDAPSTVAAHAGDRRAHHVFNHFRETEVSEKRLSSLVNQNIVLE
jgi:hypothetical protein